MFWDIFNKICENNNTKPNTVAKNIGVSSATCTKWKNGAIPNGETLLKLADYLKVSTDYLLGRTEQQKAINNDNVVKMSKFDETTTQVAEMFSQMNLIDKSKVLSLMVELSQKKVS